MFLLTVTVAKRADCTGVITQKIKIRAMPEQQTDQCLEQNKPYQRITFIIDSQHISNYLRAKAVMGTVAKKSKG